MKPLLLREWLLTWLIRDYDLRGKETLYRLLRPLCPERSFVRSAYGMDLVEDYRDVTWRACCVGYAESVVPEELSDLPANGCLIDVGANAGVFSLLAARRLGEDGLVIAFELNPVTFGRLVANVRRNDFDCAFLPLNMGLGRETRAATVTHDDAHTGVSHVGSGSDGGARALLCGYDDLGFLPRLIGDRPVYVKVDVEGFELEVLSALRPLLEAGQVRKVIVEIDDANLERFGATRVRLYELMGQAGYDARFGSPSSARAHYDEVFTRRPPGTAGARSG